MSGRKWLILLPAACILLRVPCRDASAQSSPATQPTVTVDASVKWQTIRGWGGTGGHLKVPDLLRGQLIETLVDDLGLNRLRWEPPRHQWEYPFNDNDDPNVFNWDAFRSEEAGIMLYEVLRRRSLLNAR